MLERNDKTVLFGIIFVNDRKVIDNLRTQINQDIKFVDVETWQVYEKYIFNKKTITHLLGFFNNSFEYFT